jgi:hypothetical protein
MKPKKFVFLTCCQCSVKHGITTELYNLRKKDHDTFYCPNGHKQVFLKPEGEKPEDVKAERDRLKAEVEKLKAGL